MFALYKKYIDIHSEFDLHLTLSVKHFSKMFIIKRYTERLYALTWFKSFVGKILWTLGGC